MALKHTPFAAAFFALAVVAAPAVTLELTNFIDEPRPPEPSVDANGERSLLDKESWVRGADKEDVKWRFSQNGKSVTFIRTAEKTKDASIWCNSANLDAFRGKESELVVVMDGWNVVRGWCETNRWAGDRKPPGPRDFTPVSFNFETKFSTYASWHTPDFDFFPDGTYTNLELVIPFCYPSDGTKFGINLRACCESGHVTYKKVYVRESKTKYMDKFMPLPEGFRCEYTDKVLKAGPMRGIVAGCGCTVTEYEKIRGWGCNLIRFWMNPDTEGDFEKTDALLPELERLGLRVILAPATPGPRMKDTSYKLFNDDELYNRYIENWRRVAEHYKGDERIFAFDLMNEPFQPLRKKVEDKYNFLAVQFEAAKAIREIDPDRVLIASATGGSSPGNYNTCDMRPLPLKDVIYQMHFYAPFFLTHAGLYGTKLDPDTTYPGAEKRGRVWTKQLLSGLMDTMNDFSDRWGARFYVGEFSYMSIQPGAAQWLDDVADLLDQRGWIWTFHSYGEFYGWNLESIRDAETGKLRNIKDGETTDRLEVMKKHWAKNWE